MNRITEDDLMQGLSGKGKLWRRMEAAAASGRGIQLTSAEVHNLMMLRQAWQAVRGIVLLPAHAFETEPPTTKTGDSQ